MSHDTSAPASRRAPQPSGGVPMWRAAAALAVGAIGVMVFALLVSSRVGGAFGPLAFLLPAVVAGAAITATAPIDRALAAVCFFVAVLPLGSIEVGPLQVVQLVAAVAVMGVLVIETARGDFTPVPWPVGLPLSAMVVSAALSTYATPVPDVTFRLATGLLVGLLLVTVVHSVTSSPDRLRLLARLTVAAGFVIGVRSIGGASEAEVSNGGAVVSGRAVGIFSQPNELGIFCAMLLPIGLGLVLAERDRRARVLVALGTLGIFAGLVVSLSRGAWTGAVVGLLALWLFLPDRRRFLVPVTSVVVGAGALLVILARLPIVAIVNQRLLSLFDGTTNPYDERPAIYAEARRQITDAPWIGHGPGAFPIVGTELNQDGYYLQAAHAHNLVLNTWAEYGAVGVLCLLALVVGLAGRLLAGARAVRDHLDDPDALLAGRMVAATTAGLVAVLAHGLVDYPFRNPVTSTSLWFVVGLCAGAARVAYDLRRTDTGGGSRIAIPEQTESSP